MKSQDQKFKEAQNFFGQERMAKLESILNDELNQQTSFLVPTLKWSLFVFVVGYSAVITYLYLTPEKMQKSARKNLAERIPKTIYDNTLLSTNASLIGNSKGKEHIKITVQQGENLTLIAQKLIKSNKIKNTVENRKIILNSLRNINDIQTPNHIIRAGDTIISLPNIDLKQICKN